MTQYLLLLGCVVVAVTLLAVMKRAEWSARISFSMHAAQSRGSYVIFALGLTGAVTCFAAWFVGWFAPQFHPGWLFTSVFFTALALLLVAAWVRWEKGKKGEIHDFAAYRMAYLMPVLPAILVFNPSLSLVARTVAGGVVVAQLILLYLLFFVPATRRHFFRYQLMYIALTFGALFAATYV